MVNHCSKAKDKMAVKNSLTVRLLVSCSGSGTTKLLGLVPPGVSDEKRAVELDQDVLALLINVLLIVSHKGLRKSLSDGVDLRSVSTTLHTDADVNVSKSVLAEEENWLL